VASKILLAVVFAVDQDVIATTNLGPVVNIYPSA
jgi:hypothetical protein